MSKCEFVELTLTDGKHMILNISEIRSIRSIDDGKVLILLGNGRADLTATYPTYEQWRRSEIACVFVDPASIPPGDTGCQTVGVGPGLPGL